MKILVPKLSSIAAICAVWLLIAAPVQAQSGKATAAEVRELVSLLKLDKVIAASIPLMNKQIIDLIASLVPIAKSADLEEVKQIMNQVFARMPAEFVKLAVPLYQENLTAEEVRGLIRFYKSPVGQSVITKLPRLTQQGQQIGALVGEKLAKEAFENSRKRLRQKGYQL